MKLKTSYQEQLLLSIDTGKEEEFRPHTATEGTTPSVTI